MKKLITLLSFCFIYYANTAQFNPDHSNNFNSEVIKWQTHFDSIRSYRSSQGDSTSKIEGLSSFFRWKSYWEHFVSADGNFELARQAEATYLTQN